MKPLYELKKNIIICSNKDMYRWPSKTIAISTNFDILADILESIRKKSLRKFDTVESDDLFVLASIGNEKVKYSIEMV